MPNYRRWFVPGGTYFFTANLLDRKSRLLTDHIGELRAAYRETSRRQPLDTIAICILPNHLHCIWTLPENDSDFSAVGGGSRADFRAACRAIAIPRLRDVPENAEFGNAASGST